MGQVNEDDLSARLNDALNIDSTTTKTLNELDDYSLLLILEMLNIKDASTCSLVCI